MYKRQAKILSGAVAVGAANNVAIQGSVGWSMIGNTAEAALKGGTLRAGILDIDAANNSKAYTLAGAVAGSGTAAIGAAINVVTIGDTTRASVDGSALEVSETLDVNAAANATTKTLAIAGALAGTASIAGSNTSNFIDNTTEASIAGVTAQGTGVTGDVTVRADTQGKTYCLAGALAVGGTAGVGAASSVNSIAGSTTARVDGSVFEAISGLDVEAESNSLIRTAAVSGAGGGTAAVGGSVTTNFITTPVSYTHLDVYKRQMQVGGNNAGVAFAYNTIKNTHAVSVNDATLTATSAGTIALTAADKADIIAVSAGIGGSTGNFTGVGSASYLSLIHI